LLVDMDTAKILYAQNPHAQLRPGSLTKMVTALVAVDWLPAQALVPVTPVAANVYPDKVGMVAGQDWPLNDTLQALLIFSANDAAYALAQRVSGSLARFAVTMQETAAQLGMTDHPVLRDPAGLDGQEGFEGGNTMSPWDVAIAARALMANPELAAIVSMKALAFTGPGGVVYGLDNQNLYFLDTYPGAIGIKTGLTDAAGFCVAEEAERGGRHMLAIVMNGSSSYQTAADLLNQGFATPVRAEPANAAVLPAIVEPDPPLTVPPKRFVNTELAAGSITADDQGLATGGRQTLAPDATMAVAAAAVPIAAGALVVGLTRRRRKRPPAGAHSRS
jgi:serine-type D-Ala-D-Ala carboxypeptidase (penicillin-binding protein 5/6)